MREDDTLIMPPKVANASESLVHEILSVGFLLLLVIGAFVGAAIFALGILIGVLVS